MQDHQTHEPRVSCKNHTSKAHLLAWLLLLGTGGGMFGWWFTTRDAGSDHSDSPIRVEPADEGYVGSRVCADCHHAIWEKYQGHAMAHSLTSVVESSPVEDYADRLTFTHPDSREYRVERSANRVVHHESTTDEGGNVLYDQAVEIQYALGSGKRGRSYLFDRGGLLYVSPISWYTTSGRWDAAPGYAPLSHPRFERRANDQCLSCHAGRMSYDRRLPDRYGQPPFLEQAIGCERCHGPGAGHVRRHESPDAPAVADAIVNPAKLDVATRGDICNQCHLQDDVRILRYGRSIHDFRPGQSLEDVWAIFIDGGNLAAGDMTRAVNQVQQMRASVCYKASGGRLECISCHDPHGTPQESARIAFYDERCLACHHDRGCALPIAERTIPPAEGSCIACHMRPLAATNIAHTSQTDHRISRRLINTSAPAPTAANRDLLFFNGTSSRLPPDEIERARALLQLMQPDFRPDEQLAEQLVSTLSPIAKRFRDDVEVLDALGILHLCQNRPAEAERYWRQALQFQPLHEGVLRHLVVLQSQRNDVHGAIATSRQILRTDPWQAESHFRLAQFLEERGDVDQAVAEIEQALKINPTLVPVRKWLAEAYRRKGRDDDAWREERLVNRMRDR